MALGDTVNNGTIPFQNLPLDQRLPVSAVSNLAGTSLNLADDHPFSFVPDLSSNPQLRLPPIGDPVKLDHQGRVQCASCHDPHGVPNGTSVNNSSLINFDLSVASPNATGVGPIRTDLTPAPGSTAFSGSCSLRCQNVEHDNKGY